MGMEFNNDLCFQNEILMTKWRLSFCSKSTVAREVLYCEQVNSPRTGNCSQPTAYILVQLDP